VVSDAFTYGRDVKQKPPRWRLLGAGSMAAATEKNEYCSTDFGKRKIPSFSGKISAK
jgi:hypothetical protein